jgi:hypothetical protein
MSNLTATAPSATLEKDVLVLRIPLTEPRLSESGKTYLIGGLNGPINIAHPRTGKPIKVSCNAFFSAKA